MIRLLLLIPVLILIIAFALSNQAPVQLGLWPTGITTELPLSIAVLAIGAMCFVLGAAFTWAGRIAATARAIQAERTVAVLRAQLADRPVAISNTPGTGLALR